MIDETGSLAAKLNVKFPVGSLASIRNYVESHKAELLVSTTGLAQAIESESVRVRDDHSQLKKSVSLYEQGMSIYADTSRQVNRTGSMPLILDMEEHYHGLVSDDLKSLLTQRKWSEFQDVMNSAIAEFQSLKNLAVNYEAHQAEYQEFEDEPLEAESDEEKAYRILGVPPTATNEQIKKIHKQLALIYHPDTSVVKDDEKSKEINWAYGILKSARRMS